MGATGTDAPDPALHRRGGRRGLPGDHGGPWLHYDGGLCAAGEGIGGFPAEKDSQGALGRDCAGGGGLRFAQED